MTEQEIIRRLEDMEYQAGKRHAQVMGKLAAIQANLIDQAGRPGFNVVLEELRGIKRVLGR